MPKVKGVGGEGSVVLRVQAVIEAGVWARSGVQPVVVRGESGQSCPRYHVVGGG